MDKNVLITMSPDGKIDRAEGQEELKKDPKKRWKRLKKALDNMRSILDLQEENKDEEGPSQDMPSDDENEMGDNGEDGDNDQDQGSMDENTESQDQSPDQGLMNESTESQDQQSSEPADEEQEASRLADALRQDGYSEQEVAFILHNQHAPEIDQSQQAKADATKLKSQIEVEGKQNEMQLKRDLMQRQGDLDHAHKQALSQIEIEHKKKNGDSIDTDLAHKKRMLDLEYEQKRQEMQIELEMKRKEMEVQLESKKKAAEAKIAQIGKEVKKSEDDSEL